MKDNRLHYILTHKKLYLTKKQLFFHYAPAIFGFLPLLIVLITGIPDSILLKILIVALFLFSFALVIYRNRHLNMLELPVSVSEVEFKNKIKESMGPMNWIVEEEAKDIVILTTEFQWTNWGSLLTIVRTPNSILVNSICDLYNRPA